MTRCSNNHEVWKGFLLAHPYRLWGWNLASWLTLLIWILLDASAGASWNQLAAAVDLQLGELSRLPFPFFLMAALLGLSLLGMVVAWVSIVAGPRNYRSLLAWMATIGLTSLWLGLIVNMPDLIWSGYRFRLHAALPKYEAATRPLCADWPNSDGEMEAWGPYSAYPIAQPKMLLMLAPPEICSGSHVVSVERAESGGVRLELTGKEQGVWLEWHPPGSEPSSFVGGLADPHRLIRTSRLRDNWFVVRYK
ncbi:hypothetical protein LOC68_02155 [Blastopirellula sp. JC732]|uniref:Uncharacterized protein n=1 Tax=Blastopirellula sediminis TaxID=2894196 RepID=A0A9X1MJ25_9BACT|nr:hypothetical protein [Blastopirellula sediminis]MCC9608007.1 hypothetical protein [Blastopirellula sediminis]MCC9627200.1 hypothetical protein [Blastopirellula sediminis]